MIGFYYNRTRSIAMDCTIVSGRSSLIVLKIVYASIESEIKKFKIKQKNNKPTSMCVTNRMQFRLNQNFRSHSNVSNKIAVLTELH